MANQQNVSGGRRLIYQIGILLQVIGMLLFFSVFISFINDFGNFDNFDSKAASAQLRGFSGLILAAIGRGLQSLGRNGVAGSGWVLDTEQERKDLEPINRMRGKQLNDVLEEANLNKHLGQNQHQTIKIRCRNCRHLNDETNRFCGGCGKKI